MSPPQSIQSPAHSKNLDDYVAKAMHPAPKNRFFPVTNHNKEPPVLDSTPSRVQAVPPGRCRTLRKI